MKNKLIVTLLLTITAFVIFREDLFACAPGSPSDVYESKDILKDYYPLVERVDFKTPEDYPILNQNYGVITPGWSIEYLLPPFLTAENTNLSSEIKSLLFAYYVRTIDYRDSDTLFNEGKKDLLDETDDSDNENESSSAEKPFDQWLSVRNIYIKEPYSDETDYLIEHTLSSCTDQALDRAIEDYEYRKSRFSDTELENWVKNQDEVFQNCFAKDMPVGEITKTQAWWQSIIVFFKNINKKPTPIDSASPSELLQYDQEYQRTAGAYYSKNYTLAVKLFREIINNKSHPHRQLAALSLGWCFIGWDIGKYEADLKAEKSDAGENYIKNLKETQKYYEKMYANSDYSSVKFEIQKYLDFVIFRADPAERLIDAEKTLLSPGDAKEFARQLEDFKRLWYKYFHRVFFYQKEEPRHEEIKDKITKSQSPFLRFLLEWEKPTAEGIQYSLDNYGKNNDPLWLILALRQSGEGQKDFGFIKDEINKITSESPFYLTAQYYWLELLAKDQDSAEEARIIAERFIKETYDNDQLAAFSLFSDIRENLASDPRESFKFSIRYSLATYDENWDSIPFLPYYSYGPENPTDSKKNPLFSNKTKLYLSSLPPRGLSKFIVDNSGFLKDSLARYLKLTVFYRSLVLDDLESADLIAKSIATTDPVLAPGFNKYLSTEDTDAKKFMAAKILIDYPGVYPQIGEHFNGRAQSGLSQLTEIDIFRHNWASEHACMDEEYKPENYVESDVDKEVNKNLDNFLAEILLGYMTKNPSSLDPKLLHQIVDFCHLSACQNEETSNIARQAFQLLHSRYPGNYWAEQTPYWY